MTRLVPSAWGSTARLFGMALALYFRSARLAACVSVVVMVVNGVVPIATAWFTATLIDGLGAQSAADVRTGVVGLASIGIAIALVAHASSYVEQEISRRITLLTHLELFAAVSAPAGLAELEDSGYHDRLRLAREASQFAPTQLVGALLTVGSSAITVGGFAAVLFSWSPVIGTLVMASAVPTLVAQVHLARRRGEMLVRSSPFWRRQMFYAALLLDMRAAKEIRLFGLAGFLQGRMLDEMRSGQDEERRQDRLALSVDSLLSLATGLVAAAALAVFAAQVYGGQGTAGDMVVLIAALAATQSTLTSVVGQVAVDRRGAGDVPPLRRHHGGHPPPGVDRRAHPPPACAPGSSCGTCGSATRPSTTGSCPAWTCRSRTDGRSRSSGTTAPASRRSSSCCAASTSPPGVPSCGTASTSGSSTPRACDSGSRRRSRTS